MAVSDEEYAAATRWGEEQRAAGYAVAATYDPHQQRVVVTLTTGAVMRIDPARTRALHGATPEHLSDIEIAGAGLILFWPRLDEGVSISTMRERFPPERAGADMATPHHRGGESMPVSDEEYDAALRRGAEERARGYAVSAVYDPDQGRVVVALSTGAVMRIDPARTRALNGASPEDLAEIEIMPGEVDLYWPRLDEGVSLSVMRERFLPEGAGGGECHGAEPLTSCQKSLDGGGDLQSLVGGTPQATTGNYVVD